MPLPPNEVPALRIASITMRGFRNLAAQTLVPGPRFNVLSGENGSGKSSVLEAIDYLATWTSFRAAKIEDLIQYGQEDAYLGARVVGDLAPRVCEIRLFSGKTRSVSLDEKKPRSLSAWKTALRTVLFHPGDLELVRGAPEARRRFVDRVLSHLDATYAAALHTYDKALRSRNRLLKDPSRDRERLRSISAFDPILADAGAVIGQARARLVKELGPLAEDAFGAIFGEPFPFEVAYAPRVEPSAEALRNALSLSRDKDLARGFTGDGPHADDLALRAKGASARHRASQGQHRAIVLALKVAELSVLSRRLERTPMLLLDDVSSELDRTRTQRLFSLLASLGGQIFLTTTHPEFILLDEFRADFRLEQGRIVSPSP